MQFNVAVLYRDRMLYNLDPRSTPSYDLLMKGGATVIRKHDIVIMMSDIVHCRLRYDDVDGETSSMFSVQRVLVSGDEVRLGWILKEFGTSFYYETSGF